MSCLLSLSNHARGYEISFGDAALSAVTVFSGAPYAKRHWELANKSDSTLNWCGHKVIAILEAIPIFGALASLVDRIIAFIACRFCRGTESVKETSEPFFKGPQFPIDLEGYKQLNTVIGKEKAENPTLYIKDETGTHEEKLLGVLGRGSSKQAVLLDKGRALLLPNMRRDPIGHVANRWERIVCEEVGMSNLLTEAGLLSPQSKQVSISFNPDGSGSIPAYLSETFQSLGETKGWFILDLKNDEESSTWKEKLFKTPADRNKDENWDAVFAPLLTDIAKICIHGIPGGGDSLNIAIVKKPDSEQGESSASAYEVRYFGFDFSSKGGTLAIPKMAPNSSDYTTKTKRMVSHILEWVLDREFNEKEFSISMVYPEDLYNRLVEKYTKTILTKINELSN